MLDQAADFLEKLMMKVTGIAADVIRPPPKFIISDEEYLKVNRLSSPYFSWYFTMKGTV